ncbi:Uracil-DNA glycosylase [Grifola frondosa]|uniref:Uracil-DNA glycosylase n=1 Tax=Grifola frondosa TaxID=5627 RepID=A0A1C7MB65_GRIFR|nr:Uracil-DNA glycosylase [Grifola frondosa]
MKGRGVCLCRANSEGDNVRWWWECPFAGISSGNLTAGERERVNGLRSCSLAGLLCRDPPDCEDAWCRLGGRFPPYSDGRASFPEPLRGVGSVPDVPDCLRVEACAFLEESARLEAFLEGGEGEEGERGSVAVCKRRIADFPSNQLEQSLVQLASGATRDSWNRRVTCYGAVIGGVNDQNALRLRRGRGFHSTTTRRSSCFPMPDSERVVYLEDLEAPSKQPVKQAEATAVAPVVAKEETKVTATSTGATAVKRQRTLVDMFSGPSSAPSAKKLKVDGSTPSLNSIPLSMSELQNSFSDEEKKLLSLECETLGKSWLKLLKDEIRKPYFLQLKRFLYDQGVKGVNDSAKSLKVYPSPQNIYSWSNLTPLGRVKVVIIGQDPYHGPGQAHGLCFSVPPGIDIPPSLRNIYAEIKTEYPAFEPPKHGNLTSWAENGVLLLNTCLTVKANDAGSHSGKGWEQFTDKVIEVVDRYGGANIARGSSAAGRGRGIVFLAWGAWAAKRVAKLDKVCVLTQGDAKKHLILKSAHPSPLSAHRGFMGNGHFKQANDWLQEKYGPDGCVDWCKL